MININFKSKNHLFFTLQMLIFSLAISSCIDDKIIELQPIDQIEQGSAFSTPSLIQLSVHGIYNAAQIGYYPATGEGRGYPFGAAFIQQGDARGEDAVNLQFFYFFTYTNSIDPTTPNNVAYWSDTYRMINRANLVIKGVKGAVEKNIISKKLGDSYIGQAKFFRAIGHLELLFHFAYPYQYTADASHYGVPYRDIAYDEVESIAVGISQGRNTVAECYQKILEDLNQAEELVTNVDGEIVEVSKSAAIGFKVRAYLHMRDWENVINEGNKLFGSYTLESDPNTTYVKTFSNSESIFSIYNSTTNNPGPNGALASQYKRRRLVAISPIIWRNPLWLSDDKRRGNDLVLESEGLFFTNKYKDEVSYSDDTPVLRFAEVLLSMAEANVRKSNADMAEAVRLLNLVRDRSLSDQTNQTYTLNDFSTKAELVNAIITERRIEFVLEGKRWPDIHRLQNDDLAPIHGIPAKLSSGNTNQAAFALGTPYSGPLDVRAVPMNEKEFLWPLPQQEINSNPTLALQQNPGW